MLLYHSGDVAWFVRWIVVSSLLLPQPIKTRQYQSSEVHIRHGGHAPLSPFLILSSSV
jgi:hypothetical protein